LLIGLLIRIVLNYAILFYASTLFQRKPGKIDPAFLHFQPGYASNPKQPNCEGYKVAV
jgi:hypothetical protein